jgi:hypothetical protein
MEKKAVKVVMVVMVVMVASPAVMRSYSFEVNKIKAVRLQSVRLLAERCSLFVFHFSLFTGYRTRLGLTAGAF